MNSSVHDLYFSSKNKNHMFKIISKIIFDQTKIDISTNYKYIILYKSHYALNFDKTDTDDLVLMNKELLDNIGTLILNDILSSNDSISTTIPRQQFILSSNHRLPKSLHRYNYLISNQNSCQLHEFKIVQDSKNNFTSVLYLQIQNDLIQLQLKTSKHFDSRKLYIYYPISPFSFSPSDNLLIQILDENKKHMNPSQDKYLIQQKKIILIQSKQYLCISLDTIEDIHKNDLFQFFKNNILQNTFPLKIIKGNYLLFETDFLDFDSILNLSLQNHLITTVS